MILGALAIGSKTPEYEVHGRRKCGLTHLTTKASSRGTQSFRGFVLRALGTADKPTAPFIYSSVE